MARTWKIAPELVKLPQPISSRTMSGPQIKAKLNGSSKPLDTKVCPLSDSGTPGCPVQVGNYVFQKKSLDGEIWDVHENLNKLPPVLQALAPCLLQRAFLIP